MPARDQRVRATCAEPPRRGAMHWIASDLQNFAASPPLTGALLRGRDGRRAAHATSPHPSTRPTTPDPFMALDGLGLCSENLIGTNSQPAFQTIRILPQYRNSATQYTQSSEASFSFHSPMILSYYSRHLDQSLLILNLFDQHQG